MAYKTVNKPLEWFKGNPENYRAHPPEQQAVLRQSLQRFGVFRNVVARPDGTILAGHGILAAAQAEGMKSFPCVIFEGTDEEARALMVADNEQARLAQDDPDQLSQLLTSLAADGLMDVTGHDDDSLAALLEQVEAQAPPTGYVPQEDEGPGEPPAEPVTKLGDVWVMGDHRLVCGSSREAHVLEAAFAGKTATMCWTDPPYGVDYGNHGNDKWGKHAPIANDALKGDELVEFWRDVFVGLAPYVTGDLYAAAPPGPPMSLFDDAMRKTPFERHQWLVWVKQQLVLGRANYHYRHEQVWYGWRKNSKSSWAVGRDKDSVFNVDRPHRSEEHPTMKPVELVAEMVANSSRKGETVADPFMGSGTTLIACEQLGRKAVGIELSPAYCDVICRRYSKMSGKPAILESTGETFDALQQQK